jgi:hypothetical protein
MEDEFYGLCYYSGDRRCDRRCLLGDLSLEEEREKVHWLS